MNTLTYEQLRELDAWIAEHVMGLPPAFTVWKNGSYYRPEAKGYTDNIQQAWRCTKAVAESEVVPGENMKVVQIPCLKYTADPAAAMEVLKKCLNSQIELNFGDPFISKDGKNYWIRAVKNYQHIDGDAETLELAICLFAKKLFTK